MDPFEQYYQMITKIYLLCATLFSAYCYVIWVRPCLPGNPGKVSCETALEGRKQLYGRYGASLRLLNRASGRLWGIGAVYVVTMQILYAVPVSFSNVVAYGLGTFAAFVAMCLTDRQKIGQKVFLAVTFFCMRWQAWTIVSNIMNWMSEGRITFFLSTKDHESLSFIYALASENYAFWFRIFIVDTILDFVLGAVLMYCAVRFMLRICNGGQVYMRGKELLLLAAPSVLGVFAYVLVKFYDTAYESETGKSVLKLPGYSLMHILYSLISYITILVIVYVFLKWKQEQEADGQRRILTTQMKEMQRHIAEVERLYTDQRRLRHDMGNHLMTLEQLYGREEYEAAGRYAQSLKNEVQGTDLDIRSGNPVTDVILSEWKKEMEERGISFRCDFHYPQKGKLDAFDVSIILNNGLHNAIEASEREKCRQVILVSRRIKNMYMIEMANVFTGQLHIDEQSGLPATTKTKEGHGFGLASIRHVARKYYGDSEIKVEEYEGRRCWVLRVMLQMQPECGQSSEAGRPVCDSFTSI